MAEGHGRQDERAIIEIMAQTAGKAKVIPTYRNNDPMAWEATHRHLEKRGLGVAAVDLEDRSCGRKLVTL